jgi:hypothetical protein
MVLDMRACERLYPLAFCCLHIPGWHLLARRIYELATLPLYIYDNIIELLHEYVSMTRFNAYLVLPEVHSLVLARKEELEYST